MKAVRRALLLACLAACGGREGAQGDATSEVLVDDASTGEDVRPIDGIAVDSAPTDTIDATLVETTDGRLEDTTDAMLGDTYDSTLTDSTDASCRDDTPVDFGSDVPPLRCPVPVSDGVTFDLAPSHSMCAESIDGTFQRWSCPCRGYRAITYDVGSGCFVMQLFDESTNAHVAKIEACGWPWTCLEGPPTPLPVPAPGCDYESRGTDAGVAVEHCP